MKTYVDLEKENEVMRALLTESLAHGLHHPDCEATKMFLEIDVEVEIAEAKCNCYLKIINQLLAAPEVIEIDQETKCTEPGCGHPLRKHAGSAGLCVFESCSCFMFKEPK